MGSVEVRGIGLLDETFSSVEVDALVQSLLKDPNGVQANLNRAGIGNAPEKLGIMLDLARRLPPTTEQVEEVVQSGERALVLTRDYFSGVDLEASEESFMEVLEFFQRALKRSSV